MTDKMRNILEGFDEGWMFLCTGAVTAFILLFAIFGGEVHIQINFDSWNELMKTLRK